MTSIRHKFGTRRLAALLLLTAGAAACAGDGGPSAHEPVAAKPSVKAPGAPAAAAAAEPAPAAPKVEAPATPDPCLVLDKLPHAPPVYASGRGVVLTKLMRTCTTRDGKSGVERATPWLAMGIPCTGGAGRVDTKG